MGLSLVKPGSKMVVRRYDCQFTLTWFFTLWFTACQERSVSSLPQVRRAESRLDSAESAAGTTSVTPITESFLSSSTLATSFTVRDDGSAWGMPRGNHLAADIGVCWARSALYSRAVDGTRVTGSPSALQRMRWVSQAVEHSWQRYTNIYFYGAGRKETWAECTDEAEPARIIVGFGQRNFADRGRLSDSPTRVLIDMHLETRDEIQKAAFSLFGQALKLRTVDDTAPALPTPPIVVNAQSVYGLKATGMLIDWTGRCVYDTGAESATGGVWPTACFPGVASEIWRPKRFANVTGLGASTPSSTGNGRCLTSFGASGSTLAAGDCANAAPIEFTNWQWKAFGELCVAATKAESGATLELVECQTAATLTRWNFDFLEPRRISLAGTSTCLEVVPGSATADARLVLEACDATPHTPEFLTTGELRFSSGFCATAKDNLAKVGSPVVLGNCVDASSGSRFHLSGRLKSAGRCATMNWAPPTGADISGTVADCNLADAAVSTTLAPDTLEWDYYW